MKELSAGGQPGRNDFCWCGSGKKYKKCHMSADAKGGAKVRAESGNALSRRKRRAEGLGSANARGGALIKTPEQIEGIRKACAVTRDILDMLEPKIRPGVTTDEIDTWVHEATLAAGGVPSPLNYRGFPKSVCTSINEVVCHGIPEDRTLQDGDIVNVDVTTTLAGYFGDSSRMYLVGDVAEPARKLVQVTRECLERGIAQVKPGGHVGDIGQAIQRHAESHGYSVVRDFVGHGTGVRFHEDPQIPHYGVAGQGHPFFPGMVFTIEPMINMGDWRVRILDDGWTAITRDGSLSAQWEHTLLVTSDGVDVLTA